jgi:hypothetical protein
MPASLLEIPEAHRYAASFARGAFRTSTLVMLHAHLCCTASRRPCENYDHGGISRAHRQDIRREIQKVSFRHTIETLTETSDAATKPAARQVLLQETRMSASAFAESLGRSFPHNEIPTSVDFFEFEVLRIGSCNTVFVVASRDVHARVSRREVGRKAERHGPCFEWRAARAVSCLRELRFRAMRRRDKASQRIDILPLHGI